MAGLVVLAVGAGMASETTVNAARAAEKSSSIDGTWRVSYTRTEFVNAGAHVEELGSHRENWGSYVLRLQGGRWTGTKVDAPRGRTGSGRYSVKGQIVTFNKLWPYRWKVNGDTLMFRKLAPGANVPTGFAVKPWRRVK